MAKRSGKFYRKNEADVMKELGFEPVPNSGSGWLHKEDGENEFALCQLKSTDANSIKINKIDLDKLQYHALVSHKLPVFAIQFLQSNEVYLLIRPEDLPSVTGCILTGETKENTTNFLRCNHGPLVEPVDMVDERPNKRTIKSGFSSQKDFRKEQEEKFKKKGKSAL